MRTHEGSNGGGLLGGVLAVIEAAPAGRADGDGDTIRTHGTNVIEAAASVVTASTWPMVPTWF